MSETGFRPIDIDFDVYQLVVLEKRGFDEPDNDALRRLLGLDGPSERTTQSSENGSVSWRSSDEKVELPEGTELKMTYSGIEHTGRVVKGRWEVGGEYYDTPSGAATGVARTKSGHRASINGWIKWHVKRQNDVDWILLDKLRNDGPK